MMSPTSDSASMPLAAFLAKHNLADLEEVLRDLGAETGEDLLELEDEDLDDLNLKLIRRKKLDKAITLTLIYPLHPTP